MGGQAITGKVSYQLSKPFSAEKLTLELIGQERLLWEGSDDKHHSSKHSGKIYMKRTILKLQEVIQNFPSGEVKPGSHSFPFTIQLPNELEPSFFFVGNDCEFRVVYKLLAKLGNFSIGSGSS